MRYVGSRLNSLLPIHALDFQPRHIATTMFSGGYRCYPLLSVRWSGFVAKIMKTWLALVGLPQKHENLDLQDSF